MPDHPSSRGPKRLAIVHYHLQPGGVTTVVEHTEAALKAADKDIQIVVLTGQEYPGNKLANVRTVDSLDYQDTAAVGSSAQLAEALKEAALEGLEGKLPDLWHCHNHSLGKNVHFPDALQLLKEEGQRLFLQIHDFSEDGRPNNHAVLARAQAPYPLDPHVHYATINSRDRQFLIDAGLPETQVTELPNPIIAQEGHSRAEDNDRPLLLYPTRGIRRKNLGEAVLLAALCRDRAFIAATRAPDNPAWQSIHEAWVQFAAKHTLPIAFAVVDHQSPADHGISSVSDRSFQAWTQSANAVLTTSVAEGFGLAYLESLMQGLPLMGRDLPEITADFKEQGLCFPGLYHALRVPLAWVGQDALLTRLDESLATVYQTYGVTLPKNAAERALSSMLDARDRVDFGRLPESLQQEVIIRVADEATHQDVVFETPAAIANAELWLDSWFHGGMKIPRLSEQRHTLTEVYSKEAYAERLLDSYTRLLESQELEKSSEAPQDADVGAHLLDTFLSPERFQFLRT